MDSITKIFFHDTPTMLDGINTAKVLTGVIIFYLGGLYGYNMRTTIYTGLHVSYLIWWMLEQALFPPFQNRFGDKIDGIGGWIMLLMVVGVFYALPAWNSFRNKKGTPHTAVTIACIMMFSLGSLLNVLADVQMHTSKGIRKGLVTEGIFRLCQNPNWLGDYLRYGSFCLLSGHISSFILLFFIISINIQSMQDPNIKGGMLERYGKTYAAWIDDVPNRFIPNFDLNTRSIMLCVLIIWVSSFALGYFQQGRKTEKYKTA